MHRQSGGEAWHTAWRSAVSAPIAPLAASIAPLLGRAAGVFRWLLSDWVVAPRSYEQQPRPSPPTPQLPLPPPPHQRQQRYQQSTGHPLELPGQDGALHSHARESRVSPAQPACAGPQGCGAPSPHPHPPRVWTGEISHRGTASADSPDSAGRGGLFEGQGLSTNTGVQVAEAAVLPTRPRSASFNATSAVPTEAGARGMGRSGKKTDPLAFRRPARQWPLRIDAYGRGPGPCGSMSAVDGPDSATSAASVMGHTWCQTDAALREMRRFSVLSLLLSSGHSRIGGACAGDPGDGSASGHGRSQRRQQQQQQQRGCGAEPGCSSTGQPRWLHAPSASCRTAPLCIPNISSGLDRMLQHASPFPSMSTAAGRSGRSRGGGGAGGGSPQSSPSRSDSSSSRPSSRMDGGARPGGGRYEPTGSDGRSGHGVAGGLEKGKSSTRGGDDSSRPGAPFGSGRSNGGSPRPSHGSGPRRGQRAAGEPPSHSRSAGGSTPPRAAIPSKGTSSPLNPESPHFVDPATSAGALESAPSPPAAYVVPAASATAVAGPEATPVQSPSGGGPSGAASTLWATAELALTPVGLACVQAVGQAVAELSERALESRLREVLNSTSANGPERGDTSGGAVEASRVDAATVRGTAGEALAAAAAGPEAACKPGTEQSKAGSGLIMRADGVDGDAAAAALVGQVVRAIMAPKVRHMYGMKLSRQYAAVQRLVEAVYGAAGLRSFEEVTAAAARVAASPNFADPQVPGGMAGRGPSAVPSGTAPPSAAANHGSAKQAARHHGHGHGPLQIAGPAGTGGASEASSSGLAGSGDPRVILDAVLGAAFAQWMPRIDSLALSEVLVHTSTSAATSYAQADRASLGNESGEAVRKKEAHSGAAVAATGMAVPDAAGINGASDGAAMDSGTNADGVRGAGDRGLTDSAPAGWRLFCALLQALHHGRAAGAPAAGPQATSLGDLKVHSPMGSNRDRRRSGSSDYLPRNPLANGLQGAGTAADAASALVLAAALAERRRPGCVLTAGKAGPTSAPPAVSAPSPVGPPGLASASSATTRRLEQSAGLLASLASTGFRLRCREHAEFVGACLQPWRAVRAAWEDSEPAARARAIAEGAQLSARPAGHPKYPPLQGGPTSGQAAGAKLAHGEEDEAPAVVPSSGSEPPVEVARACGSDATGHGVGACDPAGRARPVADPAVARVLVRALMAVGYYEPELMERLAVLGGGMADGRLLSGLRSMSHKPDKPPWSPPVFLAEQIALTARYGSNGLALLRTPPAPPKPEPQLTSAGPSMHPSAQTSNASRLPSETALEQRLRPGEHGPALTRREQNDNVEVELLSRHLAPAVQLYGTVIGALRVQIREGEGGSSGTSRPTSSDRAQDDGRMRRQEGPATRGRPVSRATQELWNQRTEEPAAEAPSPAGPTAGDFVLGCMADYLQLLGRALMAPGEAPVRPELRARSPRFVSLRDQERNAATTLQQQLEASGLVPPHGSRSAASAAPAGPQAHGQLDRQTGLAAPQHLRVAPELQGARLLRYLREVAPLLHGRPDSESGGGFHELGARLYKPLQSFAVEPRVLELAGRVRLASRAPDWQPCGAWTPWTPEQQDTAAAAAQLLVVEAALSNHSLRWRLKRLRPTSPLPPRVSAGVASLPGSGPDATSVSGGQTYLTQLQAAAAELLPVMRPHDVMTALVTLQGLGKAAAALPAAALRAAGDVLVQRAYELPYEDLLDGLSVAAWLHSDAASGRQGPDSPWLARCSDGVSAPWRNGAEGGPAARGSRGSAEGHGAGSGGDVAGRSALGREHLRQAPGDGSGPGPGPGSGAGTGLCVVEALADQLVMVAARRSPSAPSAVPPAGPAATQGTVIAPPDGSTGVWRSVWPSAFVSERESPQVGGGTADGAGDIAAVLQGAVRELKTEGIQPPAVLKLAAIGLLPDLARVPALMGPLTVSSRPHPLAGPPRGPGRDAGTEAVAALPLHSRALSLYDGVPLPRTAVVAVMLGEELLDEGDVSVLIALSVRAASAAIAKAAAAAAAAATRADATQAEVAGAEAAAAEVATARDLGLPGDMRLPQASTVPTLAEVPPAAALSEGAGARPAVLETSEGGHAPDSAAAGLHAHARPHAGTLPAAMASPTTVGADRNHVIAAGGGAHSTPGPGNEAYEWVAEAAAVAASPEAVPCDVTAGPAPPPAAAVTTRTATSALGGAHGTSAALVHAALDPLHRGPAATEPHSTATGSSGKAEAAEESTRPALARSSQEDTAAATRIAGDAATAPVAVPGPAAEPAATAVALGDTRAAGLAAADAAVVAAAVDAAALLAFLRCTLFCRNRLRDDWLLEIAGTAAADAVASSARATRKLVWAIHKAVEREYGSQKGDKAASAAAVVAALDAEGRGDEALSYKPFHKALFWLLEDLHKAVETVVMARQVVGTAPSARDRRAQSETEATALATANALRTMLRLAPDAAGAGAFPPRTGIDVAARLHKSQSSYEDAVPYTVDGAVGAVGPGRSRELAQALAALSLEATRRFVLPLGDDEFLRSLLRHPGLLLGDRQDAPRGAGVGPPVASASGRAPLQYGTQASIPQVGMPRLEPSRQLLQLQPLQELREEQQHQHQHQHQPQESQKQPREEPADDGLLSVPALAAARLGGPSQRPGSSGGSSSGTWALDSTQRAINKRLAEIVKARDLTTQRLMQVLRVAAHHSHAVALPTQVALHQALSDRLASLSPPQLEQVLLDVRRSRFCPPPFLVQAARRVLAMHGKTPGGGGGASGASLGDGSASNAAATLPVVAQLMRCFVAMSPAADLDSGLARQVMQLAAAVAMRSGIEEAVAVAAEAGGTAPEQRAPRGRDGVWVAEGRAEAAAKAAAPPPSEAAVPRVDADRSGTSQLDVVVRPAAGQAGPVPQEALDDVSKVAAARNVVALARGLVRDVRAVCNRLRPAHRNDVLAALAPLQAMVAQSSDVEIQSLFLGMLEAFPGKGWRGVPSLAHLQLLVAHLPYLDATPELSYLVARLFQAHEPHLSGTSRERLLPPWRVADQLLRAAGQSVQTVKLEVLDGLQERVLLLPSDQLMVLAARCDCLHLLPPHTLAAMVHRLRVFYGPHRGSEAAGPNAASLTAAGHGEGISHAGASNVTSGGEDRYANGPFFSTPFFSADGQSPSGWYGDDGDVPPASVALAGLVEAISRRMLSPESLRAVGADAAAAEDAAAGGGRPVVFAAAASGRPLASEGRVVTDPPLLSLGMSYALAAALAAEGPEAVPLTAGARDLAGRVTCALAAQALTAPPVRPLSAVTLRKWKGCDGDDDLHELDADAGGAGWDAGVRNSQRPVAGAGLLPPDPNTHLQLLQVVGEQHHRRGDQWELLQRLLSLALSPKGSGTQYGSSLCGRGGGDAVPPLGSDAAADATATTGGGAGAGGARLDWLLRITQSLLPQPRVTEPVEQAGAALYLRRYGAAATAPADSAVEYPAAAGLREADRSPPAPEQVLQLQLLLEDVEEALGTIGDGVMPARSGDSSGGDDAGVTPAGDLSSATPGGRLLGRARRHGRIPAAAAPRVISDRTRSGAGDLGLLGEQFPAAAVVNDAEHSTGAGAGVGAGAEGVALGVPLGAIQALRKDGALGVPSGALDGGRLQRADQQLVREAYPIPAAGEGDGSAGLPRVGAAKVGGAQPGADMPYRNVLRLWAAAATGRKPAAGVGVGGLVAPVPQHPHQAASSRIGDGSSALRYGPHGALAMSFAERRELLGAVRERLASLVVSPDPYVYELLAPPQPRRVPRAEAIAVSAATLAWQRQPAPPDFPDLLSRVLGLTRGAQGGGGRAARGVGGKPAEEQLYETVRGLLDELEVELSCEVQSGVLAPRSLPPSSPSASFTGFPAVGDGSAASALGNAGGASAVSSRRQQLLLQIVGLLQSVSGSSLFEMPARETPAISLTDLSQSRRAATADGAQNSGQGRMADVITWIETRRSRRQLTQLLWGRVQPALEGAAAAGELGPVAQLRVLEALASSLVLETEGGAQLVDRLITGLADWLLQQVGERELGRGGQDARQRETRAEGDVAAPAAGQAPFRDPVRAVGMYKRALVAMELLGRRDHPVLKNLEVAFAPRVDSLRLDQLVEAKVQLGPGRRRGWRRQEAGAAPAAAADADALEAPAAPVAPATEAGAGEAATGAEAAAVSRELLDILRRSDVGARLDAFVRVSEHGAADGPFVEALADMILYDSQVMQPPDFAKALWALALAASSPGATGAVRGPNAAELIRASSKRLKVAEPASFAPSSPAYAALLAAPPPPSLPSGEAALPLHVRALVACLRLSAAGSPAVDRALVSIVRRRIATHLASPECQPLQVAFLLRELAEGLTMSPALALARRSAAASWPLSVVAEGGDGPQSTGSADAVFSAPSGSAEGGRQAVGRADSAGPTRAVVAVAPAGSGLLGPAGAGAGGGLEGALLDAAADAVLRMLSEQTGGLEPSTSMVSGSGRRLQGGRSLPVPLHADQRLELLAGFHRLGYSRLGGWRWEALLQATQEAVRKRLQQDADLMAAAAAGGNVVTTADGGDSGRADATGRGVAGTSLQGSPQEARVESGAGLQDNSTGLRAGRGEHDMEIGDSDGGPDVAFWVRAVQGLLAVEGLPSDVLQMASGLLEGLMQTAGYGQGEEAEEETPEEDVDV